MEALKLILLALSLGGLAYLGGRHRFGKSLPPLAFFAIGTLMGPFGFSFFSRDQSISLRPLALFCVAWIGLIIGAQADLRLWRRIGFHIPRLSIGIGVVSGLISSIPILAFLIVSGTPTTTWIAATLVMAAAGSVSALTKIRTGRVTSLSKACSSLDDFACLLLACLPFSLMSPAGTAHSIDQIARNLGLIAVGGIILGLALVLLVSVRAHIDERLTICLGIVAMLAGASAEMGLAPFVVAGFAGLVFINTNFPAKELIYEMIIDAERPIGLFVLLYAGTLITHIEIVGLLLGLAWAALRIVGRFWAVKRFKAPNNLAFQTLSIGAAAPIVVVAFELLTKNSLDQLLLQATLCGWFATELAVVSLETRRRMKRVRVA